MPNKGFVSKIGIYFKIMLISKSKSLPETVPETRTSLPDTRNESSGSTRTEPYPKLDYPNRTETRKNATRSDTTLYRP